jgi:biotin synthase
MDEALQALCFAAATNSTFFRDQLPTTNNPQAEADRKLIER